MKKERSYLADSSFLIDLFEGKEIAVRKWKNADRVISSILCFYELNKLARFDEEKLLENTLVELNQRDVQKASKIYRKLKKNGEMIGQINILIGAQLSTETAPL
ncbi:MAG: hypothetical protein ABEJ56_05190 [Candidatus Nanohaloarchaea archaeon]